MGETRYIVKVAAGLKDEADSTLLHDTPPTTTHWVGARALFLVRRSRRIPADVERLASYMARDHHRALVTVALQDVESQKRRRYPSSDKCGPFKGLMMQQPALLLTDPRWPVTVLSTRGDLRSDEPLRRFADLPEATLKSRVALPAKLPSGKALSDRFIKMMSFRCIDRSIQDRLAQSKSACSKKIGTVGRTDHQSIRSDQLYKRPVVDIEVT